MEAKKAFPQPKQKTTEEKHIQKMPWSRATEIASGVDVLLVPYGSISKAHGHHLPLDTDYRQAIELTEHLAAQLNENGIKYLITPPLGFSYFPAFKYYPGSINLDKETAVNLLISYCKAYADMGCRKFYIVNTGISTLAILEDAREKLALAKDKIVINFFDYREFNAQLPPEFLKMEQGTHAGALETSFMLALDPRCVHMSEAVDHDVPDKPGPLYPSSNPPPTNPEAPGILSDSGVWGAPTKATLAIGEKMLEIFRPYALEKVRAL